MHPYKIVWFTGLNNEYYNNVFSNVITTWDKLPGDVIFYVDDAIKDLEKDPRAIFSTVDYSNPPDRFTPSEYKFWKKSRSIITGIKDAVNNNYDFAIWLDADVEILTTFKETNILPNESQLLSANSKIPNKNTALDTGFVAFNLKNINLNKFLYEYQNFWSNGQIQLLAEYTLRYDAPALEKILKDNNIGWKNLWYGFMKNSKRGYCGFEDSELENYFLHYFGKYKRKLI
jgi:hypothetical protein